MPTTPRSQSALSSDQNFLKRLSGLLLTQAVLVAAEAPATPDLRRNLAHQIITQPTYQTQALAPAICNGTNLLAANTTYNFEAFAVETDATDAAIIAQLAAQWDVLAGV